MVILISTKFSAHDVRNMPVILPGEQMVWAASTPIESFQSEWKYMRGKAVLKCPHMFGWGP
jgi:hypothetical protein